MKTRYSVNERGVLVDREGNTIGRLTSLTLEVPDHSANSDLFGGDYGGESLLENSKEEKRNPRSPQIEIASPVEEVWNLYDRLIGKGRRKFVAQTHGVMIREAIKATDDIELVKKAIVGLSRSPHHMGQNEQRKTYNDLRYALKPIRGTGETIQERVEKMSRYADGSSTGALTALPTRDRGVLEGRVESDKNVIRELTGNNGRPLTDDERRRQREATSRLAGMGIKTSFRDTDGWPIFIDEEAGA